MKKAKTESMGFRCTLEMKNSILSRSLELGMQPSEYMYSQVEKDLLSKSQELPARDKTFIESQLDSFSDKLLGFFVENIDKKLQTIDHKVSSLSSEDDSIEKYLSRLLSYAHKVHARVMEDTVKGWRKTIEEARKNAAMGIEQIMDNARPSQLPKNQ
jgi:GTPase involved in cell partitioning and DNA repair